MIRPTFERQRVAPYVSVPNNLAQRQLLEPELWQRLPMDLARALNVLDVRSCSDLRNVSVDFLVQHLPYRVFSLYRDMLQELRRVEGPRTFQFFRLLSGRELAENVHLY